MLPPATEHVWAFLKDQPILGGFVLIGGSALALRIGHRLSEDLDLAWPESRLPRARVDARPFGNSIGVCPEGTPGNSPALQRRVIEYEIQMSPAGTIDSCIAAPRTGSFFSRPCGTWFCFPSLPAVETAGYSRVSLRDRALTAFWYFRKALRLDALRRAAETTGFNFQSLEDEATVVDFAEAGLDLLNYQQNYLVNNAVKVSLFAPERPLAKVLTPKSACWAACQRRWIGR